MATFSIKNHNRKPHPKWVKIGAFIAAVGAGIGGYSFWKDVQVMQYIAGVLIIIGSNLPIFADENK